MSISFRGLMVGLCVWLALVVTVFVYWSGLPGMFLVDDTYNLELLNAHGGVTDWASFRAFVFDNPSGMLGRPVSMLSFLLNDQYYPGAVESYRYTNLMIHCLCGLLLFVFLRQLLGLIEKNRADVSTCVALIAMFWWLILPLNVSTALYIIQRMTQLATLFSILGLISFLYGRKLLEIDYRRGVFYMVFGLYVIGGLALLSKESGALIFLYALACEFALLSSGVKASRIVWWILLAPLFIGVLYFVSRWSSFTGASNRDFTTYERVLTESRILWDYAFKIVIPSGGKMGLVHDDIVVSKDLLQPISTLFSVFGHLFVVVAAWLGRKKYPLVLLAVCWFYFGHSLESTVIPLELYFEHRNYMPSMMLITCLVWFLWGQFERPVLGRAVVLLLVVFSVLVCAQRAAMWGKPLWLIKTWASEHPNSMRAQTMQARTLLTMGDFESGRIELERLRGKWPDAVHFDLLLLNYTCRGSIAPGYDVRQLLERMKGGVYQGSFPSVLENTYALYGERRCEEIDANLMHDIFSRVDGLKNIITPVKAKAAFWDMYVYTDQGDLAGAIGAIDKAFKYQKSSFILYHKAKLLFSAGLFDLALVELDAAIAMESRVAIYKQQRLEEYRAAREVIQKKISDENNEL